MILDVGCGKRKRGDIGVDISRETQADIIADAHYLPFKNEVFSKVVSVVVLEHSPCPLAFLKEIYRVLKPNGILELTTDNAQYYKWSVLDKFGIRHENYHSDHYMIFYPKNVERLFKLANFKVEKIELIRKQKKLDFIIKLLVKIGICRRESLYYRFKVTGKARKEAKN